MDAYDKALYFLSLREYTEKELSDKLSSKGYESTDIEKALTTLKDEGALSDERYAECYVRSRLKKTAEGKRILIMRLTRKGVGRERAEETVNNAWVEGLYIPALRRERDRLERKYSPEKVKLKLMQKGFTEREISKTGEEK